MAQPFIGQMMMFGGNFAPLGWAKCEGQQLSIDQNTALFALIGTIYGGNGQTTFALPDMRGRLPISQGQGPGLNNRTIGEQAGAESVTLVANQLGNHAHSITASSSAATSSSPGGNVPAVAAVNPYAAGVNAGFGAGTIGTTGSSQPHENMMPYLCVTFIIALEGIFPSRN